MKAFNFSTELIPGEDTVIFMDDEYYTTSGVLKITGMGKSTLSSEIKNENIEVFRHPNGNLFSKPSVRNWVEKRTVKAKR